MVTLSILVASAPAHARRRSVPVIFSWGGERIIKVADFPDTENFRLPDGRYVDPGYKYKQVKLFFIPVWNYDGQWCGYINSTNQYLNLNKAELDDLAESVGIQLPDRPSFSFWEIYGGKLVFLSIFIVLIIMSQRTKKPSTLPHSKLPEPAVSGRTSVPMQMDSSQLPGTPERLTPPRPLRTIENKNQSTDESQG